MDKFDVYLSDSQSGSTFQSQILYLLRDSQQSTLEDGNWLLSVSKLGGLIQRVINAGFSACEVGGGRFFEIAVLRGRNPFYVLNHINHNINQFDVRKRRLQMQVLTRGRNGMGFESVSRSVQDALVSEHQKVGISIFRCFHALNDIESIYVSKKAKHTQGALAYTTDPVGAKNPIYTPKYYVNYALLLIEKGVQSLCIKDMAGQLTPEVLSEILLGIQRVAPKIPITLHMHCSDEEKTLATVRAAIQMKINGVEFALPPLAGGTSHFDFSSFCEENPDLKENIHPTPSQELTKLIDYCHDLFDQFPRVDLSISREIRKKFCEFGVPGGAVPSVISLLKNQFSSVFKNPQDGAFEKLIDQYMAILQKVREEAGRPALVTPTADIVCRQAIFCLSHLRNHAGVNTLPVKDFYATLTPEYCRLVLGHYGFVYRYGDREVDALAEIGFSKPIAELINYCSQHEFNGKKFKNYWEAGQNGKPVNPVHLKQPPPLKHYVSRVYDFIFALANRLETQNFTRVEALHIAKSLVSRFATIKQLALMLAMPPKGKDEAFIFKHVLLGDFNLDGLNPKPPFNKKDTKKILLSFANANAQDDAWMSRSIDLLVFFDMSDKFLDEEARRLANIVQQMQKIKDEVRKMNEHETNESHSWLNAKPKSIEQSDVRLSTLRKQYQELVGKIKIYQNSDNLLSLKKNVLGLEFLNTYVYSTIRKVLENIKIL